MMILDVDETMRTLLVSELARVPGSRIRDAEQITFDSPIVAEGALDGEAHLNLHLHDIRENVERRGEGQQRLSQPTETRIGLRRLPIHMDLTYLLTAHAGGEPLLEHRLLGDALMVLLRYMAVPEEYYAGTLKAHGPSALPLWVAQPEHLGMFDLSSLWQAFGGKLRPALLLRVTAPINPFETRWTIAVREAVLGSVQGTMRAPVERAEVRVSAAGVVLRQDTEDPIVGVAVTVDNWPDAASETDAHGFFRVLNLSPGPQHLRFAHAGYRPQELDVIAPPAGRPDQMEPTVIALLPD